MGFFKDLHTLKKQGDEINKTWDPAAQMQSGMAQMQAADQMLQQQTAATQLAATGTPAELQVTASRDTGTYLNMQPLLQLDLLVHPEGGAPYPTTVDQVVPVTAIGRLTPGASLRGKVDPATPTSVWIDWTA